MDVTNSSNSNIFILVILIFVNTPTPSDAVNVKSSPVAVMSVNVFTAHSKTYAIVTKNVTSVTYVLCSTLRSFFDFW